MNHFLSRGGGNQLLGIYALDGQDIGQKFLNVSEGSAISANTGFQVADGSDVRLKLCGKGLAKITFTIQCRCASELMYADIVVSGAYYSAVRVAQDRDDQDEDFYSAIAFDIAVGNGTTRLGSWSFSAYHYRVYGWIPYERFNNGTYHYVSNATFSFGSRVFSTERTAWALSGSDNMNCSGSF